MSSQNIPVEKLKGRDGYENWCFAMRAYLEHEGLWEYVELGTDAESYTAAKEAKAKAKIILACDTAVYPHIRNLTSAKGMWDELARVFVDDGLCRRVILLRRFTNISLEECASTEDYVNKMISTVQSLRDIRFDIDDEWVAHFLLAGLPDTYRPMIMALQNQGKVLNLEDIKLQLLQQQHIPTTSGAGSAMVSTKEVVCYKCGGKGHYQNRCSSGSTGGANAGGHSSGSTAQRNRRSKNNRGGRPDAMVAMALRTSSRPQEWIIDSGATSHMTFLKPGKETASCEKSILTADGKPMPVQGVGSVDVKLIRRQGNISCELQEVLHVPDLCVNLLSVQRICQGGRKVVFEGSKCSILDGSHVFAEGVLQDGLYRLKTTMETAAVARTDSSVWHRRLGHLCGDYMVKLKGKIGPTSIGPCSTCDGAKMTRGPFHKSMKRAAEKLELVHSDVGEMDAFSLGGSKYYVTFLDDHTRKLWFYPLKHKSDVPGTVPGFPESGREAVRSEDHGAADRQWRGVHVGQVH